LSDFNRQANKDPSYKSSFDVEMITDKHQDNLGNRPNEIYSIKEESKLGHNNY